MRNLREQLMSNNTAKRNSPGFSLIEMMIALALVTIVLAVVFEGIVQTQQRNFAETAKVDTVQETRDFVDQMVRDIHDVGYPPGRVINGNPNCVGNVAVSCGLISFSPTQIVYEGDLDGTGTVYRVWVQLVAGPKGNCPCTLQRGLITKAAALANNTPVYFTEVNGVLNSGNGAGVANFPVVLAGAGNYAAYSTADMFQAFDINADPVGTCDPTTVPDCSSIRSLQITANVVPNYSDPQTKTFQVYSITSKARLNN
jgi:prepilin-type N-terminal cleavage/methylation domain-containing protein